MALKPAKELNDNIRIADVYASIGDVYKNQGDVQKAEEYYKNAFQSHQEQTFSYFLNDIKSLLNNGEINQLPYAKYIFEF